MTDRLTLSAKEAAAILGVAPSTVYDQVHRGLVPNVGLGKTVRIPRSWLEAHWASAGVPFSKVETIGSGVFS